MNDFFYEVKHLGNIVEFFREEGFVYNGCRNIQLSNIKLQGEKGTENNILLVDHLSKTMRYFGNDKQDRINGIDKIEVSDINSLIRTFHCLLPNINVIEQQGYSMSWYKKKDEFLLLDFPFGSFINTKFDNYTSLNRITRISEFVKKEEYSLSRFIELFMNDENEYTHFFSDVESQSKLIVI